METPTKSKGALSAVAGVFSARKEKQSIAQLTAENEELKKLERLRPQLMELQQKVSNMEKEAEDNKKLREEESASILDHNKELATALKQAQKLAEKCTADKEDGLAMANEWSSKAEKAEREVRRLSEEIDDMREQMTDLSAQSIDPLVVDQLNEKIIELEKENKHWQRMAQNLSKDVQKLSGTADTVHIKEENIRLQRRLEEVTAECNSIKEAMQKMAEAAVASSADAPKKSRRGFGF